MSEFKNNRTILIIGDDNVSLVDYITTAYAAKGEHITLAHAEREAEKFKTLFSEKIDINREELVRLIPTVSEESVFEREGNYRGYIPCPKSKKRRRKY